MNCEQIAELLPDYLQDSLGHDQRAMVEVHLQSCDQCREEVALWQKLSLLPEEQPGPELRARFKAMLDAYQEGRSQYRGAAKEK
ncbi:MAG TPA: zf-HC2 domain-containing protein, partial [Candidatus Angelobacter sp.]|nr:zf-HC2 domain-containing protein [Candidatus Angelobacter sp.]